MVGAITETLDFWDLVELSGYRNVVTTNFPPAVSIHHGSSDEKIVTNGVAAYYVSENGLPDEKTDRARQMLERLHALGDWAAGEIVERHRRDEERLANGYYDLKPRLTVHQMFVRRYLKTHTGSSIDEISVGTSLSISEVQALTEELCGRGILVVSGQREARYELSASEQARYLELE